MFFERIYNVCRAHSFLQLSIDKKILIFRQKTRVYQQETRVYRQETRVYRQKTRVYQQKTCVYRQKTRVFIAKTHVSWSKTHVSRPKICVYSAVFFRKNEYRKIKLALCVIRIMWYPYLIFYIELKLRMGCIYIFITFTGISIV
jgi:hypothetical protein